MQRDGRAAMSSVLAGGVIWGWVVAASGRAEPWDAPQFWTLGYPAALAACCGLGFLWPVRPWRWVAIVFAMLGAVMIATGVASGSSFSMLPFGLVALVLLAVPGLGLAALAGSARRR